MRTAWRRRSGQRWSAIPEHNARSQEKFHNRWAGGPNLMICRQKSGNLPVVEIAALLTSSYLPEYFRISSRSETVGKDQSWNLAAKIFVLAVQTAIVFLWSVWQAKHKFGFLDLAIFSCLFSPCIFGDGMTVRILKSIMRLQRQTGAECSRAEDFLMQPS